MDDLPTERKILLILSISLLDAAYLLVILEMAFKSHIHCEIYQELINNTTQTVFLAAAPVTCCILQLGRRRGKGP
jgi:hypothetical protein